MYKIRKIKNYEFPVEEISDKFDYIYRKYLNLPFDFSMQILTCKDIHDAMHLYETAVYDASMTNSILQIRHDNYNDPDNDYQQRLIRFKSRFIKFSEMLNNNLIDGAVNGKLENLNVFFFMPETYLSIKQQQSFMLDYVKALKELCESEYLGNDGKWVYKHINFFVVTNSIFIMSDCMPSNMLIVDDTYNYESYNEDEKNALFCANMYDITVKFTPRSIGDLANEILTAFGKDVIDNDCQTEPVFIGDTWIRSALKHKQNKED